MTTTVSRVLLLGLIALVALAPRAGAQAGFTDPSALNGNAAIDTGLDTAPRLASDGDGTWVVVWESTERLVDGDLGPDWDILVARSTDGGLSWSAPRALNTTAWSDSGGDGGPDVQSDGGDTWIAVWASLESGIGGGIGEDNDILMARSTDGGATWSPPVALNSTAATDTGNDGAPHLASDGLGTWVVVWSSTEDIGGEIGTDNDVLFSRSVDNGVTWSDPAALNANAGSDSGVDVFTQIDTDGAGTWVVVWHTTEADIGGGIGDDRDIVFARSTDNGATWSDPAPVNADAGGDINDDLVPHVGASATGTWVVVWSDIGSEIGMDGDIEVAHSKDGGATWSTNAWLSSWPDVDEGTDYLPQVRSEGTTWIAVWHSKVADVDGGIGPDVDLLVSVSTDDAETWSTNEMFNRNAAIDHETDHNPAIECDGAGTWMVVWHSSEYAIGDGIGLDTDILVSRCDGGCARSAHVFADGFDAGDALQWSAIVP